MLVQSLAVFVIVLNVDFVLLKLLHVFVQISDVLAYFHELFDMLVYERLIFPQARLHRFDAVCVSSDLLLEFSSLVTDQFTHLRDLPNQLHVVALHEFFQLNLLFSKDHHVLLHSETRFHFLVVLEQVVVHIFELHLKIVLHLFDVLLDPYVLVENLVVHLVEERLFSLLVDVENSLF